MKRRSDECLICGDKIESKKQVRVACSKKRCQDSYHNLSRILFQRFKRLQELKEMEKTNDLPTK